jgi:hypothetical protein
MTWYIHASGQLPVLQDEFVEGPFRVVFLGATLRVEIERRSTTRALRDRAERLAKDYIDHLGRVLSEHLKLLTEHEFSGLPPWASPSEAMVGSALHDRMSRLARNAPRALRQARHSVTSYAWPLKDCYDYLQNAAAGDERLLPEIYKMIETMENHSGSEAVLCEKTDLKVEIKYLKRLANEGSRDERHAPEDQTTPRPLAEPERAKVRACANQLLRKFEELCRSEGGVASGKSRQEKGDDECAGFQRYKVRGRSNEEAARLFLSEDREDWDAQSKEKQARLISNLIRRDQVRRQRRRKTHTK